MTTLAREKSPPQLLPGRFPVLLVVLAGMAGCGNEPQPSTEARPQGRDEARSQDIAAPASARSSPVKRRFDPVQLGDNASTADSGAIGKTTDSWDQQSQKIIAALQPFQVLLGKWRWITRKSFGDFPRNGEDLEWIWDFQIDEGRPTLTARSDTNPYFTQLSFTYLPDGDQFQATARTPQGNRVLRGTWADGGEPKAESDGKKLQHTYKLRLIQVEPEAGELWQLTVTQLDNNQYLLELSRRPPSGKQFGPLDTIRQQRLGTSFAVADSDNPGPKCIISGGLGTMTVSYKGKNYPVCCSGCAAAFNEDPERWLARLAEKQRAKGAE